MNLKYTLLLIAGTASIASAQFVPSGKKISDLPAASSVSGASLFEVSNSGTSQKASAAQIAAYANSLVSGGAWGSITGTLSAQTDLQTALDAKLSIAAAPGLYQPLDADLTSIAGLTTTAYGRGLLTPADATAARALLELTKGSSVNNVPYWPSAPGIASTLLGHISAGAIRGVTLDASLLLDTNVLSVQGANVTGLDAANVASGVLALARGGTGAGTASEARSNLELVKSYGGLGAADAGSVAAFGADGELACTGYFTIVSDGDNTPHLSLANLSGVASATFEYVGAGGVTIKVANAVSGDTGYLLAGSAANHGGWLTNLNASNLATGTVPAARIGTGTLTSAMLTNDTIVDADINANAAIAGTKIAGDDTAYNATSWDGNSAVPSKNAIRDKIESMGGGGTIELDLVAWVETDGNDPTGTVGDPSKPYQTMNEAYQDGARVFILGAGAFSGLSQEGSITIAVEGMSAASTTVANVQSTNSGVITIRDLGGRSVTFDMISSNGADGAPASSGANAGSIVLHNVKATNVSVIGGSGGEDEVSAGGGGNGGSVYAIFSDMTTVIADGGNGGSASGENGAGGSAGAGGSVELHYTNVGGVAAANGATGGSPGTGGVAGTNGEGGSITLRHCMITEASVQSSDTAGVIDAQHTSVGMLKMDSGTGTLNGYFIYANTLSGTPTINVRQSCIDEMNY
jgi:hypothetical protein